MLQTTGGELTSEQVTKEAVPLQSVHESTRQSARS